MSDHLLVSNFTEIYIKGLIYYGNHWVDDPDELINEIVESFVVINGFEYMSIALNLSQVFSTSQIPTQYSGIILFLKNVTFNGDGYLSSAASASLRESIMNRLRTINELQFEDVEIRTNSVTRKVYQKD